MKAIALPPACRRAQEQWLSCRARGNQEEKGTPKTLQGIVSAYKRNHRQRARAELDFYANLRTKKDALVWASDAKRPDGKRHNHQRRIPSAALRKLKARLLKRDLSRCTTFEQLHETIREAAEDVSGIGELTIYDTALRIGARLGVEPDFVYLHAGTRAGARALGLPTRSAFLQMEQLPTPLRRLSAREVEDCLCIYEEHFTSLRPSTFGKAS